MTDGRISQMDLLESLDGTEQVPAIRSGNKRFSLSTLKTWFDSLFVTLGTSQTITGAKIYNSQQLLHDRYSIGGRNSSYKMTQKNNSDNGGIDWQIYADADNSIIGTRKRALRGYPRKTADGSIGGYESFISCEFPTYDGVGTYTKKITLSANVLKVNGQDRTTSLSYTPTLSGDSGSGATASWNEAIYSEKGDMCFVMARGVLTSKGTCAGSLYITMPTTTAGGSTCLSGGMYAIGTGPNSSRGRPTVLGTGKIMFTASSQSGVLGRGSVAVNDEILFSGRYKK